MIKILSYPPRLSDGTYYGCTAQDELALRQHKMGVEQRADGWWWECSDAENGPFDSELEAWSAAVDEANYREELEAWLN